MHARATTSSHPSSRTIFSSAPVPPLFTPSLYPSPLFLFFFLSAPRILLSLSVPLCLRLCSLFLLLFTSLFALSPFSSSKPGLIHWKLFICLIATRRPGSSRLRFARQPRTFISPPFDPPARFDSDSHPRQRRVTPFISAGEKRRRFVNSRLSDSPCGDRGTPGFLVEIEIGGAKLTGKITPRNRREPASRRPSVRFPWTSSRTHEYRSICTRCADTYAARRHFQASVPGSPWPRVGVW